MISNGIIKCILVLINLSLRTLFCVNQNLVKHTTKESNKLSFKFLSMIF